MFGIFLPHFNFSPKIIRRDISGAIFCCEPKDPTRTDIFDNMLYGFFVYNKKHRPSVRAIMLIVLLPSLVHIFNREDIPSVDCVRMWVHSHFCPPFFVLIFKRRFLCAVFGLLYSLQGGPGGCNEFWVCFYKRHTVSISRVTISLIFCFVQVWYTWTMEKVEKEVAEPADLRMALVAIPRVLTLWEGLTPIARRDFVTWVESAKQAETRKRRIDRTSSMLKAGKRRPCCYAVVPMNLYKALAGTPRAKAQWSTLTPSERRDFVSWVESAKESDARRQRVEKSCLMLAAGKRQP